MGIIKKTIEFMFFVSVFVILLAACTQEATERNAPDKNDEESADTKESEVVEHLRIGTNAFTEGLEATRTSNADAQWQYSIYDTLIMRDPFSEELSFIPGLAESWENVESTVWEFQLREGVRFHNGNIMEAEDVAFSLNRIFEAEDPRFNNAYGRYFNNFEEVEIVDSYTVRIHLKRPDPLVEIFLSDLSGAITSKAYIEEVGEDEANHMPVGTGPYKVVDFTPGERAVLERFDDHWEILHLFNRLPLLICLK